MDLLDKYKESLKSAWGYNDYNDWPIKYNSIMHLFCKEFAKEYLEQMDTLSKRGLLSQVGEKMYNPSRFYRMINTIIYGMKRLKLPLEFQRSRVIELLSIIDKMKFGSAFNENGSNIILNPESVQAITLNLAERNESKKLHQFIGLLWAYTESIFFRAHDITKEMHGFYPYKNGKLLIREFLNLSPQKLWPGNILLPNEKVVIYAYYNSNIDLKIDSYNHFFLKKGNFVDDLIEYKIIIGNKEVSIEGIDEMLKSIIYSIRQVKDLVDKMDWKERTKKYAEIIWFRKEPISLLAGGNGEVPIEVYKNIEEGYVDTRRLQRLTDRQIDFMIKTII